MVSRPVTRDDRPSPRPDTRRRGRRIRRWVIVLGVLVLLLVGADFGASAYAEHMISQKARTQLGLDNDPSVTIHGFPFLTQAISGDYSHISLSADGVPVGKDLQDLFITAELEDVTAPISDLAAGNTKAIKIGKLTGSVTIKAADLSRVAPLDQVKNLKIEPSSIDYVKNGESSQSDTTPTTTTEPPDTKHTEAGVRVSGTLEFAGQKLNVFCFALIELRDSQIEFVPQRLQFGNDQKSTVVPPQVQHALLPNFKASVDTKTLPLSVTPTDVAVNSGSITIDGEAHDVDFSGLAVKSPSS